MTLQKYNFKTHKYEPFESPSEKVVLYSNDMDMDIECTNCAKDMKYGVGYTSRTIHNHVGLGYPVCEDCYEQELKDDEAAKNEQPA